MKTYYRVTDRVPRSQRAALGISDGEHGGTYYEKHGVRVEVRALQAPGPQRPPRRGEWYLSGAVPEAYLAYADLTTAFPIAELRCVRRVITYEEV